jgi:hypothetical protein
LLELENLVLSLVWQNKESQKTVLSEFVSGIANSNCLQFHELRLRHPELRLMELAIQTWWSAAAALLEFI